MRLRHCRMPNAVPTKSMLKYSLYGKYRQRHLIIKLALLCLLATYGLAAVHHHINVAEFNACLVCQLVDHQPLQLSNSEPPLLFPLAVVLVVAQLCVAGLISHPRLFERPRSRAPPLA